MTTSPSLTLKTSSSRVKLSNGNGTGKPGKSNTLSPDQPSIPGLRKPSSKLASPANSSSSQLMPSENQCVHCGSPSAQIKYVTRSFGKAASLLVIEAIPMWSCPHCGESWFAAQTLHEIERIKTLRKAIAVNRTVPVAAFQVAAA